MEINNIKQIKQIGTGLVGASLLSIIQAVSPVSKTNVAEFQAPQFQNPVNNVLVQPVECASGKCNCKTFNNVPGIIVGKRCMTGCTQ